MKAILDEEEGRAMKIDLNLYASLSRYVPHEEGGPSRRPLDVAEGSTILEALHLLKLPMDKVKMIFLNGRHAKGDEILHEGDRVGVFPPVAGG